MVKYISILIIFLPLIALSQQTFYPLDYYQNIEINRHINSDTGYIHTGFRPLLKSYLSHSENFDSILYPKNRDSLFLSKKTHKWFWKKLRTEDFIIINDKDIHFIIDPLLNFEFGNEVNFNKTISVNTRGILIRADIGKKFSIYSDLYENQAFYPQYLSLYINNNYIVPGQGRIKPFKETGFDFSSSTGYLSYSPVKQFNVQFGNGKNFIGEGYRSLLLSDVSFNYPLLKLTATFRRIQYINMLTSFQDVSPSDSRTVAYKRKHGSFNYLNWIVSRNFQLGFFEAIIWQTSDSNYNHRFLINYFNPLIYERLAQYSLNYNNNIIEGLNGKLKLNKSIQFYGQLIIDDIDLRKLIPATGYIGNKYGYQAGLKYFDLFSLKNLFFQAEYNQVRPYTYSHAIPNQNYSNFNEPLAHPLGANFKELVVLMNYKVKDFFLNLKYNYAITGSDTGNINCGSDIFISDLTAFRGPDSYHNSIGQGVFTTISHYSATIGYMLNPHTNLQLYVGVEYRVKKTNIGEYDSNVFLFGIRTSLNNYYYDF